MFLFFSQPAKQNTTNTNEWIFILFTTMTTVKGESLIPFEHSEGVVVEGFAFVISEHDRHEVRNGRFLLFDELVE